MPSATVDELKQQISDWYLARGHIDYVETAPIFVTCSVLELEVCDFAMLQKRLQVFHFSGFRV